MSEPWVPPNADYPPPKAGEPALHRAARIGDHDAIRALVASGSDLDAVFDIGLDPTGPPHPATPLMVAAGSGDGATVETVAVLLALGADPRTRTKRGSAADFACRGLGWNYRPGGDATRLRTLLEAGSPLTREGLPGTQLLAHVAETGDADRVRLLLELGIDPNPPSGEQVRYFQIPLSAAARSGNATCVELLLNAGADPSRRDPSGHTPLHEARSESVARALLAAGCDLDDRDAYGWTPLTAAAADGDIQTLAALIAVGADVNAAHDRGFTVFMSAVASSDRRTDVMEFLLASGADPRGVTELGYTAFHAAIDVNGEANSEESVRSTLTLIARTGVDIEMRNNSGQTPLAYAIIHGTPIEVRELCALGADPNATTPMRVGFQKIEVPLLALTAQQWDAEAKTEVLLAHGARPRARGANGQSAIEVAVAALCDEENRARELLAALEDASTRLDAEGIRATDLSVRAGTYASVIEALLPPDPEEAEFRPAQVRAVALIMAHGAKSGEDE